MSTAATNYEPIGTRFYDKRSGREMICVSEGEWAGWLVYRHPDGQWVSLREATPADFRAILRGPMIPTGPHPTDPAETEQGAESGA